MNYEFPDNWPLTCYMNMSPVESNTTCSDTANWAYRNRLQLSPSHNIFFHKVWPNPELLQKPTILWVLVSPLTFCIRRTWCHSNKSHTSTANLYDNAQLGGTPYPHPGAYSSVGMWWRQWDRQTHRQMGTINIYFASLCLKWFYVIRKTRPVKHWPDVKNTNSKL